MTTRQPKKYYSASEIDYLEHFAPLWIGFNAWYRMMTPKGGDAKACMQVAKHPNTRATFESMMSQVNSIDVDIVRTLDQLSKYSMPGGGVARVDVSGDKLRLLASRTNSVIDFLESAKNSGILDPETDGLLFLDPHDKSGVFRDLYTRYAAYMATPAMMAFPTDAEDIVSTHLAELDIVSYGRLLFHDLKPTRATKGLYQLDDVFGKAYLSKCTRLAGAKISKLPTSGLLYRAKRVQGLDPFERYLWVLYRFRSAYFHGDLDPERRDFQELGRNAYDSLREITAPELG